MTNWLENLKRYALSDDMDYRLTWEDAAIALEEIERLRAALERIELSGIDVVCAEGREIVAIAKEVLRDE